MQCRKLFQYAESTDVANCPNCGRDTLTDEAKSIRKTIEQDRKHLAIPGATVGRAIAYSSAIYRNATHAELMDAFKIEKQISTKFGEASAASHTKLALVSGREYQGIVDTRACLSVFVVSGGGWTHIYVVFRGSRGDAADRPEGAAPDRKTDTKRSNPEGAGWGQTANGGVGNLDWRANFNNRHRVPNWAAAPIMVHEGFLDVYGSVQITVRKEVQRLVGQHANAAVVVTGHSLGAAQAVLCAHDLQASGICEPFCFPFCTPRVGNMHFALDFQQRLGTKPATLPGEAGTFSRSLNFVEKHDAVSWKGDTAFERPMSDADAEKRADDGAGTLGVLRKAIWANSKTKSQTVLFYQTPNVIVSSNAWTMVTAHDYTGMQELRLGKALFK
jgi:hypothetical protein